MSLNALEQLENYLFCDRNELSKLAAVIKKRRGQSLPVDKLIKKFEAKQKKSMDIVASRKARIPQQIDFDPRLPVSLEKEKVKHLIKNNQVVILAGETGSGKTTQLPKICLELGLGVYGRIGHTQPRRVAATSVAKRIAEELKSPLGELVGYSVRFNDKVSDTTPIRLMTDGILLNEIHSDPLLLQYDCLIIDEAHERSLNIDFLLGYLKNLLPKRPDLKLIITSATIDLERFSKHFSQNKKDAPIIEISGRTYPVDVWYREPDPENPAPQVEQIGLAVEELCAYSAGDILVFLSGEAEIRETAKFLRKERFGQLDVLPLYARLSIKEQERIFSPSKSKRRVVLATNVAETSITVPGIRFVIDPGFARMSRYSVRHKIQRLPIEKVSQASANQRKGRCGRVADGVCIRLYSEEDFIARSEYTDAEILRTNLASVILQMQQSRLGAVADFPFIDMPASKQISDGINLLNELQALDNEHNLTQVGRDMAHLPIEPRLARILIEAKKNKVVADCLIITAFLSVKDPREWPFDKKEVAQQKHRKYIHTHSDFITIINLWQHLHQQQEDLSNRLFRDYCQQELINFNAYREWKSTYRQLKGIVLSSSKQKCLPTHYLSQAELSSKAEKAQAAASYKNLHLSLLSGLLSFVGQKDIEKGYQAARQSKFFIHPQSVNFKRQPAWLMAFEVVETTQAYARLTAYIEPEWLEFSAKHLLKTHYYDPFWSKNRGLVIAPMQQTLYGLKVVTDRKVDYSAVEPDVCRELFILHGLVRFELNSRHQFFTKNIELMKEVEHEIAKQRNADLRTSEQDLCHWFDTRLPSHINNAQSLNQWLKKSSENQFNLTFTAETLLESAADPEAGLPNTIKLKNIELTLQYHFEPGSESDGVTVQLPLSLKERFSNQDFERLVPGMLQDKIEYMLRSMPKRFRKNFLPIPVYAKACYEKVLSEKGSLIDIISKQLYKMTGVILTQEAWSELSLPEHYKMRFSFIDENKKVLFYSRDLEQNPASDAKSFTAKKAIEKKLQKSNDVISKDKQNKTYTDWSFDFSAEGVMTEAGVDIPIFYALDDSGSSGVRLIYEVSQKKALIKHQKGVSRLVLIALVDKYKYLLRSYHAKQALSLASTNFISYEKIIEQTFLSIISLALKPAEIIAKKDFESLVANLKSTIIQSAQTALDELLKVLSARAEVLAECKSIGRNYTALSDDIVEQMDYLFCNDFIYRFSVSKFNDFKRYLLAVKKRMQKAKENALKEVQLSTQINSWLDKRIELDDSHKIPENAYQEYLWMLEEFRISLFAQGQKTQFPISAKRLEKYVAATEKEFLV